MWGKMRVKSQISLPLNLLTFQNSFLFQSGMKTVILEAVIGR